MQTLRLFLLVVSACLLIVPSVQAAPFVSPNGYSITPAAQWTVKHSGMTRADVTILTHATKQITPTLRVMISPIQPGQTLEQMRGQFTKMYPHMLKRFKIIKMGYETVGNVRALLVIGTYLGSKQLLSLHQDLVLKNGKLYIFTYGSPVTLQTRYAPAYAQMLRSVRWSR